MAVHIILNCICFSKRNYDTRLNVVSSIHYSTSWDRNQCKFISLSHFPRMAVRIIRYAQLHLFQQKKLWNKAYCCFFKTEFEKIIVMYLKSQWKQVYEWISSLIHQSFLHEPVVTTSEMFVSCKKEETYWPLLVIPLL